MALLSYTHRVPCRRKGSSSRGVFDRDRAGEEGKTRSLTGRRIEREEGWSEAVGDAEQGQQTDDQKKGNFRLRAWNS